MFSIELRELSHHLFDFGGGHVMILDLNMLAYGTTVLDEPEVYVAGSLIKQLMKMTVLQPCR
jgi:hypothetical protein